MKKLLLVATLAVAGLVSAKGTETSCGDLITKI